MPANEARVAIETIGADIIDFGVEQACITGDLRNSTRSAGLSVGDRACLALARQRNLPAITADTAWGQLIGFNVIVIRGAGA